MVQPELVEEEEEVVEKDAKAALRTADEDEDGDWVKWTRPKRRPLLAC